MTNYPAVRNAHIVPESYLRCFARGHQIETHRVGQPGSETRNTEKVGTRPYEYRRTRPDGTTIDDVEHTLGQMEDKAAPILRNLAERWPLRTAEKAVIAQFAAAQSVRGPKWRAWYQAWTKDWIAQLRAEPERMEMPPGVDPVEQIDKLEWSLLNDTQRLTQMIDFTVKLSTALGSMHWTLVEANRRLLPPPIIRSYSGRSTPAPGSDDSYRSRLPRRLSRCVCQSRQQRQF